jgi:hypothetical protein
MKRRNFLLTALASTLAAQTDGLTLTVEVTYDGAGTVDGSHKVFVVLWDTADFVKEGSEMMPTGIESVTSKTGSVRFEGIKKSPAYISMVYDPAGKWDAASPPPTGASLGMYSKDGATPAAIELQAGKTAMIKAKFDDSFKMK